MGTSLRVHKKYIDIIFYSLSMSEAKERKVNKSSIFSVRNHKYIIYCTYYIELTCFLWTLYTSAR